MSTLSHQLFTFRRNNYLEECYFAFSYSPIPDDDGHVGGVLTNALDMTERVIEDRRRQVLRDVASRTAEARHEEEVWRVSAETLADNRSSIPFAFLYEYLPGEQQASLAAVSVETDDSLHSDSSTATARACGDSTPPSRRIACWWTLETAHQRCPFLVGRPRQTERQSCRSGCVKRASRRGSWCSAYIRAARSTMPIVASYVESQNRSPSGWPALAPTSRSANARRR